MENTNNENSYCANALMSNQIENLASALSKAQAVIENVSKDKKGFNYKYADLASYLTAAKETSF